MDNNNFNDMGNGFESSYTSQTTTNNGFESSYSNQSNMNNYNEQPFVPPTYNGPLDPPRPAYDGLEEPVSIGEWIITYLIMMVPCVNIIMMFVWAFSKNEKKSKSNYFKVSLGVFAIGFVLYIFIIIIFGATMMAGIQGSSYSGY